MNTIALLLACAALALAAPQQLPGESRTQIMQTTLTHILKLP